MKYELFIFSALATASLSAGFARANSDGLNYPVKSPVCAPGMKINAPDNGSGVFFNTDCTVAYVMPPILGNVSLTGLMKSDGLRECDSMNLRMDLIKQKEIRLHNLALQLNAQSPSPATTPAISAFGNGPLGTQMSPAPAQPVGAVAAAPTSGVLTDDQVDDITDKILDLQDKLQRSLQTYAGVEGAYAQLTYDIQMSKLVADYQKLNPNPNLTFQKMPLQIASLGFVMKENGVESAARLPAVLSVKVPGMNIGIEGQAVAAQGVGAVPQPSKDVGVPSEVTFGDSPSGQVVLTLMGACPFYDSQSDTIKSDLSAYDLEPTISANVQYEYGLEAFRNYTASYNLALMVQDIQKKTTHGGFFSSSTENSIVNSNKSTDWFQFDDHSDDPRFINDQADIVKETKADLLDRVIKQISYGNGGPTVAPETTTPAPDGASATAKAVRDNCPNLYCQAGAAALDALNAIFGSSDATAEFIKDNNITSTDVVTESRMLRYYGSFTFSDPNKKK